jgi:hypothetical protein
MSLDKEGQIIDVNKMKERIFRGGLESNILRREVWKFLLHYYPWSSTSEERIEMAKQREIEYFEMKLQWKSMNEQQKQRNSLFRDRESLIGKEIVRCFQWLISLGQKILSIYARWLKEECNKLLMENAMLEFLTIMS